MLTWHGRKTLCRLALAWTDWTTGLFGGNLTTDGLLESALRVGDVFGLGTARLRAVQPRQPCYKLNGRFDDEGMAARFARLGCPGIYFWVEEPGTAQAGDARTLLEAATARVAWAWKGSPSLPHTKPFGQTIII